MPPRDIRAFLEDIVQAAEDIASYIDGCDFEAFLADRKTYQAVLLNMEIIGEAASRIPQEIRDLAPGVEWRRIKDFRNVIAHGYFAVDRRTVWETASQRAPELRQSVIVLLGKLPGSSPS